MRLFTTLFLSLLFIADICAQGGTYEQASKDLNDGKFEEALQQFKDAGETFSKAGNSRMYTLCKLGEADAYLGLGQIDIARSIATGTEKFVSTLYKNDKPLVIHILDFFIKIFEVFGV